MVTVRFRFIAGRGKASYEPGGTRGSENFARIIRRDVAFEYAEETFDLISAQIKQRMRADIKRELVKMAGMFMYGVVGIPGKNAGPRGQLRTVAPQSAAMAGRSLDMPVRQLVPNGWERRSPTYLAQRRREVGGNPPWFHRRGGHLEKMASPDTWTGAFGGVSVSVRKHTSLLKKDAPAGLAPLMQTGFGGANDKIGVASVRVTAMNSITPAMLPDLGANTLGNWGSNPRGSGLLSKLGEPIANRLGGNPKGPKAVPFRPTIHPFLSFFLTRQLPNAVFKRIEQGLVSSRWKHTDIGSAGKNG